MTDELPTFQPSPLGLTPGGASAPITPESAKRPARKARAANPAKPGRKPRVVKEEVVRVVPAPDGEMTTDRTKIYRKKKRKTKQPRETISKMALVMELDKIASRLAELSGCDRGAAFKAISKVFK